MSAGNMRAADWLAHAFTINTLDCIVWPFGLSKGGYPTLRLNGRSALAHIVACEHTWGPKPDGDIEAAHLCNQKTCVNGRHLYWATPVDNAADRMLNGTRHPFNGKPVRHGKLDAAVIDDIRARYITDRISQQQLADEYGISQATISRYLHGYKQAPQHADSGA